MKTKELSEQKITRFGAHVDHQNWCVHMIQKSNGDWMKYSDHELMVTALRAEIASQQAKIDALMLEFCPDEMTPEQIAEWAKHQKAAPFPYNDEKA